MKIYLMICLFVSTTFMFAGMSYTEFLSEKSIREQIKAATLALDLSIDSIETTKEIRESGYLLYDDSGPHIKTKQQKILAHCTVLSVQKNTTKLNLKQKVTLTFWKQISGKNSSNYRSAWQKPPSSAGQKILAIFLEDSVNAQGTTITLQVDFAHPSTKKTTLEKDWAYGADEKRANVIIDSKKLAEKLPLKVSRKTNITIKKIIDTRWYKWENLKITIGEEEVDISISTIQYTREHISDHLTGELKTTQEITLLPGKYKVYLAQSFVGEIIVK
ncbi:hypothetical protein [Candidatus Uabimicrobium sp. HlEnr_7]|uniref:hypothetical protein n=1 Tax=Candidatus Uabimicrobium helgolandensis TaxID=3095367 RepID=UPI0035560F2C